MQWAIEIYVINMIFVQLLYDVIDMIIFPDGKQAWIVLF